MWVLCVPYVLVIVLLRILSLSKFFLFYFFLWKFLFLYVVECQALRSMYLTSLISCNACFE